MKRTTFVVMMAAFAMMVALYAARPAFAVPFCGDGTEDDGEQCDLGSNNGKLCCGTDCRWLSGGSPCVPNAPGYDACHRGTCVGAAHVCDPTVPPINPCDGVGCKDCAVEGPLTNNYSCSGANRPNDTICEGDGNKCTVERCQEGVCLGPSCPKCPEPENPCQVATCNANTGACGTNNLQGPCNDGNPCTVNEQCRSGGHCDAGIVNVGAGVACKGSQQCRVNTTCNGTGQCTGGSLLPSGSACNDFNDCRDGSTCNGWGQCLGGSNNANGTACIDQEPGAGFSGNTCRKVGTCVSGQCNALPDCSKEGLTCTNGNPCNEGFCSGGECIVRDDSEQSGAVEDFNSCTTPSSTTCNTAGFVSTPTCDAGNCESCQTACLTDSGVETLTFNGDPVPCGCGYTQ
jgi:hypothetical protein